MKNARWKIHLAIKSNFYGHLKSLFNTISSFDHILRIPAALRTEHTRMTSRNSGAT